MGTGPLASPEPWTLSAFLLADSDGVNSTAGVGDKIAGSGVGDTTGDVGVADVGTAIEMVTGIEIAAPWVCGLSASIALMITAVV
jgi:hypothetical protein